MNSQYALLRSQVISLIACTLFMAFPASAQYFGTQNTTSPVYSAYVTGHEGGSCYYDCQITFGGAALPECVTTGNTTTFGGTLSVSCSIANVSGTRPAGTPVVFFGTGGTIGANIDGVQVQTPVPFTTPIQISSPDTFFDGQLYNISGTWLPAGQNWNLTFGVAIGPFSISVTPPSTSSPVTLAAIAPNNPNQINIQDTVKWSEVENIPTTDAGIFENGSHISLSDFLTGIPNLTTTGPEEGTITINLPVHLGRMYSTSDLLAGYTPGEIDDLGVVGTLPLTFNYMRASFIAKPTISFSVPNQIAVGATSTINVTVQNPSQYFSIASGSEIILGDPNQVGSLYFIGGGTATLGLIEPGSSSQFIPFEIEGQQAGAVQILATLGNVNWVGDCLSSSTVYASSPSISVFQPTGSLQVTISPSSAVSAGARWRVDNGTWQSSGATVSDLSVGSHTVSFSTITGWNTPINENVTIGNGSTTPASGTYTQQTGYLQVSIYPSGAVNAGAQWQENGGAWQNNGTTITLPVGNYTVSFNTIAGWNTPGNQNVTINNGSTTTPSATYTPQTGSLQVTISPSSAVSAGAQWQVDNGAWQSSGATVSGLTVGNHTVDFNAISGWSSPGAQTVQINNGQTTPFTGTYTTVNGSLQVTITPSGAVTAGAQWQVDNGAWQSSGAIVSGLSVGNHTVLFNTISGWNTPNGQTVSITANQTTPLTGTYVVASLTGSLQVTITPSSAVTAGAQWQVDNGAWQSSGAIVSGLSVGNHTVSFNTISGWNTPNGQTVSITANQTTPLTGTYSQVQTPQLSVSPTSILSASGFQGGPFTPSNIQYAVNNGATGTLNWTVSADQPWVAVSQSSGQNTGTVTVSINTNANALLPNTYHSTLTFGGNGGSTNFPVELTIIASSQFFIFPPCINGLQVNINGGTYPPTGAEVTNIVLNWGDGQQTSGYFPNNHTYASAGNYTIQVTSEYSDGSSATLSQAVSPAPGVVVNCVACEIAANQGGAVSYQASVGSGTVTAGTSVTLQEAYAADLFLTANPSGNDFFVNWSPSSGMTGVNATPIATNSPSVTIVVDNDSQIIANFSSLLLAVGSPPLGSNGINLLLYAPAGSNVVVQVSTDLVNWYAWTNLTVPYSPYPISDASVTNSIARFYRAVIPTMADNFTSDNSLNSSLWAANSSILSTLAANITSPSATLETPIFTFDSAGMQMTGVNGTYQFAGVQSLNTFAPPFTVNTTVMGTQSPGNAFAVLLVNSNLNQWLCILGDLIPQTCNQNVWINYTGSGNPLSNNGKSLYGNPSLGVFYTIQISVGTNGYASVVLMTNGVTLASGSGLSVGDGPFYVVLGQKEGLPCVSGPLAATWQTISVTSPP